MGTVVFQRLHRLQDRTLNRRELFNYFLRSIVKRLVVLIEKLSSCLLKRFDIQPIVRELLFYSVDCRTIDLKMRYEDEITFSIVLARCNMFLPAVRKQPTETDQSSGVIKT